MPLKVTWKTGMRLSTDVFNALEYSIEENIKLAALIASGGRYGIFHTTKPFELSVNINNNILEVVSLSCHGITKSGRLVDIDFDSNYTTTFDTRIVIPSGGAESYILVVKMHDKDMREVNEMLSEYAYSFVLLGENSPVDNDSLPIGNIVNQYGWRLNETDFVPPCLFINAHQKYLDLLERVRNELKIISEKLYNSQDCIARHILSSIWNSVSSELISLDKERWSITPEQLFASVQKIVSSFVIGCAVDEYVCLENADSFIEYIHKPYNARHIYNDIEDGLKLCSEISAKMEIICSMTDIKESPTDTPERPAPEPEPIGRNKWNGKII